MIRQRTKEWYRARIGRFTASNFSNLMSRPANKNANWSKTALNMIEKAAAQLYFDDYYERPDNSATSWGTRNEDLAIKEFQKAISCEIEEAGFLIHPEIDAVGATPDVFIIENGVTNIAQIKCPYNQEIHLKYGKKITDTKSLKKTKSQYYWQVQGEMWLTNSQSCYFVSFDPRESGDKRLFYALIERDEEAISQLKKQILKSLEKRDEILEAFRNNEKYPKSLDRYY